jgi:hypothetical protein
MANPPKKNNVSNVKETSNAASTAKKPTAKKTAQRQVLGASATETAWVEVSEFLVEEVTIPMGEETGIVWPPPHSDIELDEEITKQGADINLGGRRMGGPTGGDFSSGGSGPALGATHPADDNTADHYGSRAETQAALEGRIANLNARKLREDH